MKSMKWSVHLILLVVLGLVAGSRCEAAEPSKQWDSLLDVTYKFSWYPRADLQKLLEVKASEYGQSLEDYRALRLTEVTGGRALADQVRTDDFVTGLPWLDYYRLSMAEFCLFLATDQVSHLQNAQSALSVLAHKTEQPEIEFWYYMYGAHSASLAKDREAFVTEMYRLWQNVIIPMEVETRNFPMQSAQAGFVKNLPFLYENLVHLLFRKAILEQEISDLYALNAMILDIQPKLTVENGYKTMAEQVVERMRGPSSDNKNVNFAVALLEATAKRYDFEDEKDDAQLAPEFFQTLKYYNLANSWADTGKGRTAILTQYMGYMNYVLRRFSDPDDELSSNQYFQNLPAMANDQMETAFQAYNRLAAPAIENMNGLTEGFEDRKTYLQGMHQLLDSTAKLSIILSDFYKTNHEPGQRVDTYAAISPLEQYSNLFNRYAQTNAEVLPDNAYFLAAYAATELGALYREQARFSTDNRADAAAFAYQMQAIEIFPLDLPGILQTAFQCSLNGQVQEYFQYSRPLTARLRVSSVAAVWTSRNPTDFNGLIALVPKVVPNVIDNAFVIIGHFPEEQASEDVLFARAVAMARVLDDQKTSSTEKTDELLTEIGRG
ncbi:MAG: hypothetical protein ACSLFH_12265, partial [Desulfuromonadales bacterium]